MKTPFYRVIGSFALSDKNFDGEWRAGEGSIYEKSPALYKENGFLQEKDALALIRHVEGKPAIVEKIERKKENKNPPLLYNLAELQNDCSKYFKISPDETLSFVQDMYEKKLLTYPRTDARVLSSAVAKEIDKNIRGLIQYGPVGAYAALLIEKNAYRGVGKSRYVNDKQITDHYAIIPTGQGLRALESLPQTAVHIYELVARRFLSIFFPAAAYEKVALVSRVDTECFASNFKILKKEGYLAVARPSFFKKEKENEGSEDEMKCDETFLTLLEQVKKGTELAVNGYSVKEGETSPPKRYNSGSMILTMENAGQFIEDEELRAQIKGSGIGTSATRAEILKKLVHIKYLKLNKKTQVITPTLPGEMIYDVVDSSMKALLDPALTASWEKGLSGVAEGSITEKEYLEKLNGFVTRRTEYVKQITNQNHLYHKFDEAAGFYH